MAIMQPEHPNPSGFILNFVFSIDSWISEYACPSFLRISIMDSYMDITLTQSFCFEHSKTDLFNSFQRISSALINFLGWVSDIILGGVLVASYIVNASLGVIAASITASCDFSVLEIKRKSGCFIRPTLLNFAIRNMLGPIKGTTIKPENLFFCFPNYGLIWPMLSTIN